ncbi:uncharacterized protein LOC124163942 isoform X2 [Ischnura elegans]|uniref:uncharacterized protein LOC124163942 isoform X2 n=1 Tax=Ischnura elegans TaxID=197161 RepID=UPI001ED881A6|nr:uncharacterized protein LOC124163942 isoform X2 [Ischnura elegans]
MKGFSVVLIFAVTVLVSGQTESEAEEPGQNEKVTESLPSLYSLLTQPMFRDGLDMYKDSQSHENHGQHHGAHSVEIMAKPLGALSFFKKELLPPMILVGIIGAVLYIVGSFIKTVVVARIGDFLPLPAVTRRKREIESQIDDLATTVLESIRKQECLERACCELGHQTGKLQISKTVMPFIAKVTSKPMVQAFQTGMIGRKYCEKYACRIVPS